MTRIEDINARLSAISQECDTASGDALTALETEARSLTEERTRLMAEIEARQALRASIAAGQTGTAAPANIQPAAPAAAEQRESAEAAEIRSFASFIRGAVTDMRTGEQNFSFGNNGSLIPKTIANRIIETVREMCPILAGAEVFHTKGTLHIPVYGPKTVDGTAHDITVAYGADFTDLTADAGAFTHIELKGYLIGALTLVGKTLLNNSDIDLTSFVIRKMAEKIAVFVENELLNGTGSSNNHCTGALSTTNTMNAGSTSAISADNLIDLQGKIPQAYQAGCCWTMHPNTFAAIKKLKDQNNRFLIQDDITQAFPYRLLGKPVYVSESMPTIASAATAVLYGDYAGLGVKITEDVSVEVLREKYATQHAIGVVAWMELDSKILDSQKLATLVMSNG